MDEEINEGKGGVISKIDLFQPTNRSENNVVKRLTVVQIKVTNGLKKVRLFKNYHCTFCALYQNGSIIVIIRIHDFIWFSCC